MEIDQIAGNEDRVFRESYCGYSQIESADAEFAFLELDRDRDGFIIEIDNGDFTVVEHMLTEVCVGLNKLKVRAGVQFKEDLSRVRKGHGDENLSRLRRIALNALQMEDAESGNIRAKRLRAGWDHDYLLKLLIFLQR